MKFGRLMSYYKRKNVIKKFCKTLLCLQRIMDNFYFLKFLKQTTYVRYLIAKLSKYVQISMLTSSESFLQRIKKGLKLVSRPHFSYNFLLKKNSMEYFTVDIFQFLY